MTDSPAIGPFVDLAEGLGAQNHVLDEATASQLVVESVRRHPGRVHVITFGLPPDAEFYAFVDARYEGDASWFSNLVHATIVVPNPLDLGAAISTACRHCVAGGLETVWSVNRVVGREVTAGARGPTEVGYRDCVIDLRSATGFISEVRFEIVALWLARETGGGRELFEQATAIERSAVDQRRQLGLDEARETAVLRKRVRSLYDTAWAESMAAPRLPAAN